MKSQISHSPQDLDTNYIKLEKLEKLRRELDFKAEREKKEQMRKALGQEKKNSPDKKKSVKEKPKVKKQPVSEFPEARGRYARRPMSRKL